MPSLQGLPKEIWGGVIAVVVIIFCIIILDAIGKTNSHAQTTAQGGIDALKLLNDFGLPIGAGILVVLILYLLYLASQGGAGGGA